METEVAAAGALGCVETPRGRLPLAAVSVSADLWGPSAQVTVRQTFVNAFDAPVEAAFVFPLPDRAAVQSCVATLGGREIEAVLFERGEAREKFQEAVQQGRRAALLEEDRPGCFTSTVGNLQPSEQAVIELRYALELPIAEGEVAFRFPLVLAPRFTPGTPLPGPSVGLGTVADTTATPDASRVTPPVLIPGSPNPVQLSLSLSLHHSGVAPESLRSALHAVATVVEARVTRVHLKPAERMDRDFILRYRLLEKGCRTQLLVSCDAQGEEGTWQLCFLPPQPAAPRPLDVVFLLDRSGSMEGWKLETARSALIRLVSELGPADRFALFAFAETLTTPLPAKLCDATADHRALAAGFLSQVSAEGGTELVRALDQAASLRWGGYEDRDQAVVLVTDGQVTNEDEVLRVVRKLKGVRVCAVGVDQAVNDGFLRRLAEVTGGTVELVESEARFAEALGRISRTGRSPALSDVTVAAGTLEVVPSQTAPVRPQSAYAGDVLVLRGRFRGPGAGNLVVSGRSADGTGYRETVAAMRAESPALPALWARASVRSLEDQYAQGAGPKDELGKALVATSLRFGVLCRFTAFCAVDRDTKVVTGDRRVIQPVEAPKGWGLDSASGRRYSGGQALSGRSAKTQAGILRGKFNYMSPEQVSGLPLDPRSEVFVLGTFLWELLSGERLFWGDSDFAVMEALRKATLPDVLPPGIEPAFEPLLRRALARKPNRRYASGADLADALESLATSSACPPAPHLSDFVIDTCPRRLEKVQRLVARALAETLPADGSCALVVRVGVGSVAEHWLAVRAGPDGTSELAFVRRLLPFAAQDDEFVRAFLDSAYAAPHPNLVRVLGAGGRALPFVAHEFVQGVALDEVLQVARKAGTRVPPRLAFEIIATVGRALAIANDLPDDSGAIIGSLHRELDLSSVMVTFDGVVKVCGVCAPRAGLYRPQLIALRDEGTARAPVGVQPSPPGPAAKPDRGLGGRLLDLLRPSRHEFWK